MTLIEVFEIIGPIEPIWLIESLGISDSIEVNWRQLKLVELIGFIRIYLKLIEVR